MVDSRAAEDRDANADVIARVDEAMDALFEAAALAMIVGSEEIMRLQFAASQMTDDVAVGRERATETLSSWARAKTNLLELARFEAGISKKRPEIEPEPLLDPLADS